ncbi:MAG: DUF1838 family protein [Gammaproteobacteria bacterium]|nr:DUF1838 family protein [Gammaproteobacteria bacterium]
MRRSLVFALLIMLSGLAMAESAARLGPAESMQTWIRLKADTAGSVTYEWVVGAAYGIPDGATGRQLFEIESLTVRQVRPLEPVGYEERSYSCRLYRDAMTGAYIDRFVNPFTAAAVELRGQCNPGPIIQYTPEKVELVTEWHLSSTALGVPMSLQIIEAGDQLVVRRDAFSEFVAPGSDEVRRELSIDSFKTSAADFANPEITSLPAVYSWTSLAQWMRILDMQDVPGRMLWSINGRKFMSKSELPAAFVAALEQRVPGALDRSIDWGDAD